MHPWDGHLDALGEVRRAKVVRRLSALGIRRTRRRGVLRVADRAEEEAAEVRDGGAGAPLRRRHDPGRRVIGRTIFQAGLWKWVNNRNTLFALFSGPIFPHFECLGRNLQLLGEDSAMGERALPDRSDQLVERRQRGEVVRQAGADEVPEKIGNVA